MPKASASVGVVQWGGSETPAELVARADVALYAAKGAGRYQTVAWRPRLRDRVRHV